jgi:hypothetical protein
MCVVASERFWAGEIAVFIVKLPLERGDIFKEFFA